MPPRRRTPRRRLALAAFVALALVATTTWISCVSTGDPRGRAGDTVRIASWNLRQFTATRDDLDYAAIADIIREGGFDLIALQEVKGDGAAVALLVDQLQRTNDGRTWATLVSQPAGNSERFAYLYDRRRVRYLGDAGFLPSGLGLSRRPFAGRFAAGDFDFTLVNVHLFAGDIHRRRAEAARLADLIAGRVLPAGTGERDVIVLGDFNTTTRRGGSLAPFEANGWLAAIDAPTNLGGTETLDNLVFDPSRVTEWTGAAGVVRFDDARFAGDDTEARRRVSDHRPVYANFATDGGDDD